MPAQSRAISTSILFLVVLLLTGGLNPVLASTANRWPIQEDKKQDDGKKQDRLKDERTADEIRLGIFPRAIPLPDFPKGAKWLNTNGPIRKADLKGKFVVIDFWTYCCINCIHILPELKKLEEKYPNEVVVIGCHSAKFEAEQDSRNITQAVMRYEIKHPVINDLNMSYWNRIGANSWPTVLMVDPDGGVFWGRGGEVTFETLEAVLKTKLEKFRKAKKLDETPFRIELAENQLKNTPLRFPGKVLVDEEGKRLFVSDSNHNRIVMTDLDGKLLATIGSGAIGRKDGDFASAEFDHPQGMALHNGMLYVADTENHLIRKIDLKQKKVTTIAGTGKQQRRNFINELGQGGHEPWFGDPKTTALNSPWDLLINNGQLIIAMAGNHQVWTMLLDESTIGIWAGNGREDIVDGKFVPVKPYQLGASSFAQPSGLTADKNFIYLADSEGSSIRKLPLSGKGEVETLVGTSEQPRGRLFIFGDVDGEKEKVRLQHPLGVAYRDGFVFVADTYNNKIKAIEAKTGKTKTIAGDGKPGDNDENPQFDEPSGLAISGNRLFVTDTNNHKIRIVNLDDFKVSTFEIKGLEPPRVPGKSKVPQFPGATEVQIDRALVAKPGEVVVRLTPDLPGGWKLNKDAPTTFKVAIGTGADASDDQNAKLVFGPAKMVDGKFVFRATVTEESKSMSVYLRYYYCQEGGEGLCKVGSVVYKMALNVKTGDVKNELDLTLKIDP